MPAALHSLPIAWIPGVTTWIVVWSVLAAATVAIVLLMRSRWREAKPWKKCALLSLWVHVLLACLAVNVRIGAGISGGPGIGPGEGGPMRIAIAAVDISALAALAAELPKGEPDAEPIVAEVAEPAIDAQPETVSREAPLLEDPAEHETPEEAPLPEPMPPTNAAAVAIDAPTAAPTLPQPDFTLDAPNLLPQPKPKLEETSKVADASDKPALVDAERTDDEANKQADASVATNVAPPTPAAPTLGVPTGEAASAAGAPRRAVPAPYANRFADRDALVVGGGGNPATERAVRAALAWLAASQEADGHWNPKRFGAGQERYVMGENRGGAGANADTGITALALLAFLGSGHTHHEGAYADNVARGLDYLRRTQGANGNLAGQAELFAHTYCHSMAAFAVSEACAMTGDAKLKPIVQRAVAYSLALQHPADGGWRYRPGDTGDMSQLGWQLMGLKSAELAGVTVPAVTWTRVERFVRSVERGAAGGLAAYRPENPPTRAMTAESLFCRQLLTRRRDGGLAPAALDEARRSLLEEPPGRLMINHYYWYYGTIALHRVKDASPASAEAWQEWNDALTSTLVGTQASDGSWPAACVWGGYGGRVYTTALGAMCLEVYYRYAPEGEPGLARHDDWQTVPAR